MAAIQSLRAAAIAAALAASTQAHVAPTVADDRPMGMKSVISLARIW